MLVLDVGRRARVGALAFAPDGRALAAATDAGVYLWRAIADGARAEALAPHDFNDVRFGPDGRWLFASSFGLVWRYDTETGASAPTNPWGGYYTRFDLSPAGADLVYSQHLFGPGGTRCRVAVSPATDLSVTGRRWEREVPASYGHGPLFLPGGERFCRVEGGWAAERRRHEYALVTYATATGEVVRRSQVYEDVGGSSVLSDDGRWLASRDINSLYLWGLDQSARAVRVRNDNRRHFTGIAFHPSGRFLAATSNDRTVKLYEVSAWTEARAFTWELGRMRSVAFSPDGTLAAAGSDKGRVVVWDVDV
jgi:WD40 repeat protein